jgi:predicted ABC-type ATPase/nucleoside phosphorylase
MDEQQLFVFAGPKGSGKSTLVDNCIRDGKCPNLLIDPDRMNDYSNPREAARASRLSALIQGKSITFETCFPTEEERAFISYAKSINYRVTVKYVVTSKYEINLQRIIEGGRDVPQGNVISEYEKNMQIMFDVIELCDEATVYDNSSTSSKYKEVFHKSDNQYFCFIDSSWLNQNEYHWLDKYIIAKAKASGINVKYFPAPEPSPETLDKVKGHMHYNHFPFLFVTVNESEKAAFEKIFAYHNENYIKGATYSYGKFGIYPAAWFHMPAQGTSNPDLCGDVIEEVCPAAVVMVGIAFGVDESRQKIGDVLVSKYILNYDLRKGSTQYKEMAKEVSLQLFNAFHSGFSKWEYPARAIESEKFIVSYGSILTGSALIDDYAFRQKLVNDFSEHKPIGGEMEAYGIYSQCRSKGVCEWIIVKAVCDWAYNKLHPLKDNWQRIAADSAVNFCHKVFSMCGGNGKGILDGLVDRWSRAPTDTYNGAYTEDTAGQEIHMTIIKEQYNLNDSALIQGDHNNLAFKSNGATIAAKK